MEGESEMVHAKLLGSKFAHKAGKWVQASSQSNQVFFRNDETTQKLSRWKQKARLPQTTPNLPLNFITGSSFIGKTDYLPKVHILLGGNLEGNCFRPFYMEYGTVLERAVPTHFKLVGKEVESDPDPLSALIHSDERLNRFMEVMPSNHYIHEGRGTTRFEIELRNLAEVFNNRNSAFVGLSVIPKVKSGKPISIEDSDKGTRAYALDYDFEPVVFEFFSRIAYYTNYVAFSGRRTDSLDQSKLILPHLVYETT